jgi:hypothetical protein
MFNDLVFLNTNDKIVKFYQKDKNNCLYILGKGFDPRMLEGLNLILKKTNILEVKLIGFTDKGMSALPIQEELIKENMKKFNSFNVKYRELNIPANTNLPKFFRDNIEIPEGCNRIIIDISSMPQSIYFNIIKQLWKYVISNKEKNNHLKLDIIACENSALDDAIVPTDLETANYLDGFSAFSNDLESDENRVSIWFPLLGKNNSRELEGLISFLKPDEICPVLPFPSKNPRRSDDILLDIGAPLYTDLIEKRNIIYVAEQNVLDVYKKLYNAISYYNEVLKCIGEPRFYISTGSSKLISLGALLVYLRLLNLDSGINISFAHVGNKGYNIDISGYNQINNQICLLCLEDNQYDW